MNKLKYIIVLAILIVLASLYKRTLDVNSRLIDQEFSAPLTQDPTYNDVLGLISKESLKENLAYLASDQLEGRMSGKRGNVLAADFLKKEFKKFDLPVVTQRFKIKRMNPGPKKEYGDDYTENVYAYIEGRDELLRDQVVVIGAHMDHIGYGPSMSRSPSMKVHPGADDNASGTVALIEVAKCFSLLRNQVKRTVVFMAFSAEEMGLLGSRFYCDNPIFPINSPDISKHVFMLNMDMVGYLGTGRHSVSFSDGGSSLDIEKAIEELSKSYSFAKKITGLRSGGSDHACFYNKKVPIAFLHTGLHQHYHKPSDTHDKINYDGLFEVTKYAFELSWNVVNGNEPPEFNYGSFVEMDLKHDHGQDEFPQ